MKIISKIKKGNIREIYLFGKKIYSYEKQNIEKYNAFEYTKKYMYVLQDVKHTETSEQYNNYIWQLWFQGETNAPDIIRQCLKSVKKYCPDKKIIVLNENTIENYIEIPKYIKEKYDTGIITKACYSDYIRTCLLAKYGGTWIDASVMLTGMIPKEIFMQDFFQFKSVHWSTFKKLPSKELMYKTVNMKSFLISRHSGSSWFINAQKGNRIMSIAKNLFEEYWKKENRIINYYIYHDFISFIILNDEKCRDIYNNMYSFI